MSRLNFPNAVGSAQLNDNLMLFVKEVKVQEWGKLTGEQMFIIYLGLYPALYCIAGSERLTSLCI